MTYIDTIKEAAKTPLTVNLLFKQRYKKNSKEIHIFYEGQDDPSFYTNFLNQKLNNEFQVFHYRCGNKDKVYDNYKKMDWTVLNKNRVLFFVDKDFSEILNLIYPVDENIFVTKYYSIENYLVNVDIFHRILRELLHINNDEVIIQLTAKFIEQHLIFCNLMHLITAWILYHRRKKSDFNLNNLSLKPIFSINDKLNIYKKNKINNQKLFKYLDEQTGIVTPPNVWKDIVYEYRTIKNISEPKYYLRGKFEIWYLTEFCNSIVDFLNQDVKKGDKKTKFKVNFTHSNAVEILGPRLKIPDDLELFLTSNIDKVMIQCA